MIICVCHGISDKQLDQYSSIKEMREAHPCLGTQCGTCLRHLAKDYGEKDEQKQT